MAADYTVNASAVTVLPTQTAFNNVTITTPVSVAASTAVTVVAGVSNTATNTTVAGTTYVINVNTSVDTTPVPSSPAYTIVAGAASQVVASAGGGQSATVGTAFATPLGATVEDQYGNPVLTSGTSVVFTAPASGASGTFANGTDTTTAPTNASGVATASAFTANTTAGAYAVSATSGALTPASFNETNVAGAASKLVASAGGGQSATVGTAFAVALAATVEDQYGNPVLTSGASVVFTAPASGASGTFANGTDTTTAPTNASGVATASAFTANTTAGAYAVSATSGALTPASFSESNVAGAASKVVASAGGGQSAAFGTAFATPLGAT
ncbi:MAG: hypothetical protein ACYCS7_16315, partial [Acidimicrobiales bacterium]